MPTMTRRGPAGSTTARKPIQPKKKGGAAIGVVVVGGAAVGGLIWWFLSRRRAPAGPPTPPPANPVVDVGDDQAVTLDATSNAEITITFSVVADNPVNLAWSRISGPAPVNFSPLSPNEELLGFQEPGTYLIRLTATDTTDSRAQGFDEMVVIVNAAPLGAILTIGELKLDGFAIYTLTRSQGDTLIFGWPVTNIGEIPGAAFIRITEGGVEVGAGGAFPIDPGQTVNVGFTPVVSLPAGVHILVAQVMEGLPPDGVAVGSAQIITLTVVSVPMLAAVGEPTINGILGPTSISVVCDAVIPVTWPVQNTGGAAGLARLKSTVSPAVQGGLIKTGGLLTIPGNTTTTLFMTIGQTCLSLYFDESFTGQVQITMSDDQNVILGLWTFIVYVTKPVG